ncbi:hypothetical protein VTL71DRAFT_3392 [Oculimacula yallundae]|uniref:Heterokaryon incompatibility domain-containing protein n=1 Tax=Oculimacula yallundae TaxID=86028 RepID=A0ABR4C712_9HELO
MDPYQYTPLEDGQIRLLQILPGSETEPVFGQLFTVSLEDLPIYTALSYAWGTGAPDETIILDGKALPVSVNLHDALRELRARPVWTEPLEESDRMRSFFRHFRDIQKRYVSTNWLPSFSKVMPRLPRIHYDMPLIWIDAVCISQKDLLERGEQVNLMRQIYKRADSLTVWLGLEADDSSRAISMLKKIHLETVQLGYSQATLLSKVQIPEVEEATDVIWKFYSRPWFSRLWIIQEYALGGHTRGKESASTDKVMFCCGQARVEGRAVIGSRFTNNTERGNHKTFLKHRLLSINNLRLSIAHPQRVVNERNWLISLVLASRTSQSTDPRDRIYASIGLAEDLSQDLTTEFNYDHIIFNYAATTEDVYSSFVKAVVSTTKRLDILGLCNAEWSTIVSRTWTPDWTISGSGMLRPDMTHRDIPGHMVRCDVSPGTECIATFAPDLSTLTVRGFVWSGIKTLATVSSDDGLIPEVLIRKKLALLLELAKAMSESEQGQLRADLHASFCRTVAWHNHYKRREGVMPQSWVHAFDNWLFGQPHGHNPSHLEYGAVSTEEQQSAKSEFFDLVLASLERSDRLLITDDGNIGRMSRPADVGDLVCVILGCAVPIVLRPVGEHYEVIGDAYVDVIMHGEAMIELHQGNRTLRDFELN